MNNLKALLNKDTETKATERAFYIQNGYFETWAQEYRNDADRGLKSYLTAAKWDLYQSGALNREKAVEIATKRMKKELDKNQAAKLEKLETVENTAAAQYITINVEFKRSKTWGYNPFAEVYAAGVYNGHASGCGYDKESAAVAEALNSAPEVLRVLYDLKENGLEKGLSDESKTACTGHDNRSIIGYGAGYDVLPRFEGGVGVECFLAIFKKAGYKVDTFRGKYENQYRISRG